MPEIEDNPWWSRTACKGEDIDLFFPPRDKSKYKIVATAAKKFCFGPNGKTDCPVRYECLWDAVVRDEQHGIWGGMSHRERNALVRKWSKSFSKTMTLQEFIKESTRKA